jgi:hypothetical protein
MPPVTIKGRRQWKVDNNGVAIHVVPGLNGNVETPMPSRAVEGQVRKLTKEKDRLTVRRDEIQTEIDEVTSTLADMVALQATVTAEPA